MGRAVLISLFMIGTPTAAAVCGFLAGYEGIFLKVRATTTADERAADAILDRFLSDLAPRLEAGAFGLERRSGS